MKKILSIIFVFCAFAANSQVLQEFKNFGISYPNIRAKNAFLLPTGCGAPTPLDSTVSKYKQGAIYIDSCAGLLYVWSPSSSAWAINTGSGTTVSHPHAVQSIAAMLALDTAAKVGEIATVADSSKSYVLKANPATTFANWMPILSPFFDLTPYTTLTKTKADSTTLRTAITGKKDNADSTNATTGYTTLYENGLKAAYVASIADLQAYNGKSLTVIVQDTDRGGTFSYSATGTADNGVVFAATGKGSGYWKRRYDGGAGVNIDWWGTADATGIQKAINFAGAGGIVNFTPNKNYSSNATLTPFVGQLINGNGATLRRMADSVVTVSVDANTTSTSITVNAVPSTWKPGLSIQLFTDSTTYATNNPVTISSISGNVVTFSTSIGSNVAINGTHPQRTFWPHDSTRARLVFAMVGENTTPLNYKISNMIFNGNRDSVKANYYWAVNPTIVASGTGGLVKIDRCQFYDIPNETIEGHGFHVTNCYAHNTSGSFVHMSYSNKNVPNRTPAIIANNITDSTNRIPTAIGGHSEGVITFSLTPGYITVSGNRFKNGSDGVFGAFSNAGPGDSSSNGFRNVLIAGNYALNFNSIFYSITAQMPSAMKAGHVLIDGNVFDNCGVNDFGSQRLAIDTAMDTLMIGNNLLVGGTTWSIPVQKSDSMQRYVLNNPNTTTPQNAAINISGPIKAAAASFTLPNGSGNIVTYNGTSLSYRTIAEVKTDLNIIQGVGSTNYLAKWTSSSSLGTGLITDNGTTVGVAGGTNVNGRLMVYKGTIFGNADPTSTDFVVSNSANNSRILVGQTTGAYGYWQWNYNATTSLATMSWKMNTGKGLAMDSNGNITSDSKISYVTHPSLGVADSLTHTDKKFVDSVSNLKIDSLRNNAGILEARKNNVFVPQFTLPTSGTGNTNSNIGTGYMLAVPNTNNIKTLFPGTGGIRIDSTSNTDALTISVDSATFYTAKGIKSDTSLNPGFVTLVLDSVYIDSLITAKSSRPYKVYTALLNQPADTSAPVATILENTLGGTVVWAWSSTGSYSATLTGAFPTGKVAFILGANQTGVTPPVYPYAYRYDDNTIYLKQIDGSGSAINGYLSDYTIEIRVYQ